MEGGVKNSKSLTPSQSGPLMANPEETFPSRVSCVTITNENMYICSGKNVLGSSLDYNLLRSPFIATLLSNLQQS